MQHRQASQHRLACCLPIRQLHRCLPGTGARSSSHSHSYSFTLSPGASSMKCPCLPPLQDALARFEIFPSPTHKFKVSRIRRAIKRHLGVEPLVHCSPQGELTEVRLPGSVGNSSSSSMAANLRVPEASAAAVGYPSVRAVPGCACPGMSYCTPACMLVLVHCTGQAAWRHSSQCRQHHP
jgi:hypothetical protein